MTGSLGLCWYRSPGPHSHAILPSPQQYCGKETALPPVFPHSSPMGARDANPNAEKVIIFPWGPRPGQRPFCPLQQPPWPELHAPQSSTGMPPPTKATAARPLTSHLRVCRQPEAPGQGPGLPSHQPSHVAQTNTRGAYLVQTNCATNEMPKA